MRAAAASPRVRIGGSWDVDRADLNALARALDDRGIATELIDEVAEPYRRGGPYPREVWLELVAGPLLLAGEPTDAYRAALACIAQVLVTRVARYPDDYQVTIAFGEDRVALSYRIPGADPEAARTELEEFAAHAADHVSGHPARYWHVERGEWVTGDDVLSWVRSAPEGASVPFRSSWRLDAPRRPPMPRPSEGGSRRRLSLVAKRVVDVALAGGGLVVLAPVLVGIAVAILVVDGRPILFRQRRAGLLGRPFAVLKFRTMRPPRRGEAWYASNPQRVTRLGRMLRSTSLDELPSLMNVIRGEMSLVGPRPLHDAYVRVYTSDERRRLLMKPGITGWAVVHGRDRVAFEEALTLDRWYVDNWSPLLDLRILVRTIGIVRSRGNVLVAPSWPEPDVPERFVRALMAQPPAA
ncbi:MAG TPA: sugar transferase [Candidatus Limnocylindrales bacterium]|nr:sugar transferase [Candidatus Limnocylindrales bacterium]